VGILSTISPYKKSLQPEKLNIWEKSKLEEYNLQRRISNPEPQKNLSHSKTRGRPPKRPETISYQKESKDKLVKKLQTLHHSHSQTLYVGLHKRTGGNTHRLSSSLGTPCTLFSACPQLAYNLFSELNRYNIIAIHII
jgi:hypothetical protein